VLRCVCCNEADRAHWLPHPVVCEEYVRESDCPFVCERAEYRHYELSSVTLLQYPRGALACGAAPRRHVDVTACEVRAQRDAGDSGCFFKLVRGGFKLEFMCPSADDCTAWVAALSRAAAAEHPQHSDTLTAAKNVAASAGPGVVSGVHPSQGYTPPPRVLRYTDIEDAEGGIGVSVGQHASGFPVVCLVDPRGPAAQCGVVAGVLICAISGTSVRGMPLPQVAELLVGPPGSVVDLVLGEHDGGGTPARAPTVRLTRTNLSSLAEVASRTAPRVAQPDATPSVWSDDSVVQKLRSDLCSFYKRVAPEKSGRVAMIVQDFVSRGATSEELQHLNDELLATYGSDLSSVDTSVSGAALDVNARGRESTSYSVRGYSSFEGGRERGWAGGGRPFSISSVFTPDYLSDDASAFQIPAPRLVAQVRSARDTSARNTNLDARADSDARAGIARTPMAEDPHSVARVEAAHSQKSAPQ
jgi:hypothetical protein